MRTQAGLWHTARGEARRAVWSADLKISVITVCYNSQATIRGAVDSFLAQDYPDKELLIIDGASTDDTLKIIAACQDPAVRLVSAPDKGAYDAMNKGLALFGGEAVGFLNSDDEFHDNRALSRLADILAGADIVYGDLHMVADHRTKALVRDWKAGKFGPRAFQRRWMPPHPTFYMRRIVAERVGGFDLSYPLAADYDLMLRAMSSAEFRVGYVPQVIADFQMGGMSTRDLRATLQGNLECLRSRRTHLSAPPVDAAFFLRPLIRLFQLRRVDRYWAR